MKSPLARPAVAVLLLLSMAALGYVRNVSSGTDMTAAAEKFLATLSPQARSQCLLEYATPLRTDWHYIPKPTRKGLQVKEMDEPQRAAALALLRAALSAAGYGKATQIMQLESLLAELEKKRTGAPLRDPLRYYFTLFGAPGGEGRWGLSVEGHHLSLNFVVQGDKVVSSTPTFFGANPGVLTADHGAGFPRGLRVLAKEEQLAFDLLASLTSQQRSKAIVADKAPNDVRDAGNAAPPAVAAAGLAAADMTPEQQALLKSLVVEYAHNLPADVAAERLRVIEADGFARIHFAWSGSDRPGVGHDYRVQGPSFLIEFNNTQPDSAGNPANHIHCVWHNLSGNFALPAEAASAAAVGRR